MKKMFLKKSDCVGCGVCAAVCVAHALEMKKDADGFLTPHLKPALCVDCGACINHCPVLCIGTLQLTEHHSYNYAAYLKDGEKLMQSASGGATSALASYVLAHGGVVYGVKYSDRYRRARTCRAETAKELAAIKDSKYMQSEKGDIYPQVKKDLAEGRLVLYTGTPCDIGAVKAYLGKDFDQLYTCELICHGTTSSKVAENYLAEQEKKHKSKVTRMSVRSKIRGWAVPHILVKFESGEQSVQPFYETDYGTGFATVVRDSCRKCLYKGNQKVADFTVGDFWGADETKSYWNANGISAVSIHTHRGKELWDLVTDLEKFEVTYEQIVKENPFLEESVPRNRLAKLFRINMDLFGLHTAVKIHVWIQSFKNKLRHSSGG